MRVIGKIVTVVLGALVLSILIVEFLALPTSLIITGLMFATVVFGVIAGTLIGRGQSAPLGMETSKEKSET